MSENEYDHRYAPDHPAWDASPDIMYRIPVNQVLHVRKMLPWRVVKESGEHLYWEVAVEAEMDQHGVANHLSMLFGFESEDPVTGESKVSFKSVTFSDEEELLAFWMHFSHCAGMVSGKVKEMYEKVRGEVS